MATFTVCLFNDMLLQRDYSVTQDLDPEDWWTSLYTNGKGGTLLLETEVNWWRPDTPLRLEVPFDDARRATYGCIRKTSPIYDGGDLDDDVTFNVPYFFWVDSARLVTAGVRKPSADIHYDVVELRVTPDVWSNSNGRWTLRDSRVVRKHMPRWKHEIVGGAHVWTPLYYPSAGSAADGSYVPFYDYELTPQPGIVNTQLSMFIVTALTPAGVMKRYIGGNVMTFGNVHSELPNIRDRILYAYDDDTSTPTYMLGVEDLLDGTFYADTGLTAEYVQSIIVFPYLNELQDVIAEYTPPGVLGSVGYMFDTSDTKFSDWFRFASSTTPSGTIWYIEAKDDDPVKIMQPCDASLSADAHFVSFPVPSRTGTTTAYMTSYQRTWEPMMYRSPCMIRRITDSVGGTVSEVPDILAFEDSVRLQNMIEMNGAVTYVYPGDDIRQAAQYGALGEAGAATLPIYNSAWRSYAAISQMADNIKYNASQAATALGGVTNTIVGAGMGLFTMGPAGAVMGAAGGIMGTAATGYSNAEEMRAKQVTIRNSPCSVQSTGSGLAVYVQGKIDLYYTALVIDDENVRRLRHDYYWYGYTVDRVIQGVVDLHSRYLFDYIMTAGARVYGDIGAEDSAAISAILDRGTVIWHDKGIPYWKDTYNTISDIPSYENMEIFS